MKLRIGPYLKRLMVFYQNDFFHLQHELQIIPFNENAFYAVAVFVSLRCVFYAQGSFKIAIIAHYTSSWLSTFSVHRYGGISLQKQAN